MPCFFVLHDLSILQDNNPVRLVNHPFVMRGEDERDMFFVIQLFHDIQKIPGGYGIKVGRGFIGQDKAGS